MCGTALDLFALADIPKNLREAQQLTVDVANRRERERDLDQFALFAGPDRLVVLDRFAAESPDTRLSCRRADVFRHDQLRGLSDRLSGGVAKEPFGGRIPEGNEAVQVFPNDGVF
jgi:hypothetical protein